jgi:hypothetical protein
VMVSNLARRMRTMKLAWKSMFVPKK